MYTITLILTIILLKSRTDKIFSRQNMNGFFGVTKPIFGQNQMDPGRNFTFQGKKLEFRTSGISWPTFQKAFSVTLLSWFQKLATWQLPNDSIHRGIGANSNRQILVVVFDLARSPVDQMNFGKKAKILGAFLGR